MDLYGPPKVGGDVLSYCGKCGMELSHVIVSMVSGKPAKVICKTCKSPHNYRTLAGKSAAPRKSASLAAPKKTYVRQVEYWETKIKEKQGQPSRPYKTTDNFRLGELIEHSKFGVGLVEEVKLNGKIVVLFRDEQRTLIHGLNAPGPS